jgi:hypothetical protein
MYLKQYGGESSADAFGKDTRPITQSMYLKQHGGVAPIDTFGKDPVPVKHDLEEEWPSPQMGGGEQEPDAYRAPSTEEQALFDTALQGRDLGSSIKYTVPAPCVQSGGGVDPRVPATVEQLAPADQIGSDQPTLHEPARGPPTFTIPNPYTAPPIQRGGGVEATPAPALAPVNEIGTEINQATFSEPSRAEPTFTIANPFTSPPLPAGTAMLPPAVSGDVPANAGVAFEVSKTLLTDVADIVQQGGGPPTSGKKIVFDLDDIKVVKIEN